MSIALFNGEKFVHILGPLSHNFELHLSTGTRGIGIDQIIETHKMGRPAKLPNGELESWNRLLPNGDM